MRFGYRRGSVSIAAAAAVMLLAGCMETPGSRVARSEPPAAYAGTTGESIFPYNPPVELSTVGMTLPVQVYPQGDDMNNNAWTRHLRDNLGIIVQKWWETSPGQLEQKTNLMIASGNIPNFFIATPMQLVQLERADLIEELSHVYPRHASANVRSVIEEAGPEVLEAAKIEGKLMGIPFTGVAKESVPVLWIREDWRTQLNLPQPATMDEVITIAEAFANRDPDGNGLHDTYGLALDKSLSMAIGLLNGYHAYKGIWIEEPDGRLAYGSIRPEMKQALGKLRELYRSGLIDPDFGMKEGGKVYDSIGAGKIGMAYGSISANTLYTQTPDSRWFAYPAPSADSGKTRVQHGLNLHMGFWVVKKGTPHPEAVLRMADEFVKKFYLNTDDNVYRQFNYDIEQKMSIWHQAPVKLYKSYKNAEISAHLEPLLTGVKVPTFAEKSALTPEEREKLVLIQEYLTGRSADWSVIARNGLHGGGTVILDYVKNGQLLADRFYGLPTKTMVQKLASLTKLEEDVMKRIILGAPLDEFDSFAEDWKRLGGSDITAEVNSWAGSR
ncbi:extracellular solute-binding protein [Paenibacillus sp. GYB004]|uniref:extracellular solute-binding protein n=1 Tax=Paenibacillus sp. GYB004 TaxID=2994393 RepID=UPI002F96C151